MKVISIEKEFVAEEPKAFDSAHASTVLELHDGNVITAWFGGSWEAADDICIWYTRKIDGVWEKPRKACDADGKSMWNPVLFRKNDTSILLFSKVKEEKGKWRSFYVESADEGLSFGNPVYLSEEETLSRGPVKNKPIRLTNHTILAPASSEGNLWNSYVDISKDDGKTWKLSAQVPLRRASYEPTMIHREYNKYFCYGKGIIQPTLWESSEGRVHMFLRSTSSRIFRSDSEDFGETWSLAYDTGLPNNNSGIDAVKLPDGTIVLVYNPRENLPNYYKGPRTPLVVDYSEDNGVTFERLAVLEDGPGIFAYPAVIANDNNEILITYTWKRQNIMFCKIKYAAR